MCRLDRTTANERQRCRPAVRSKSIRDVLDELERASGGSVADIPDALTAATLNYYLNGGFGPGELIFVGARVGKTVLGLEWAPTARAHAWAAKARSNILASIGTARSA
jgi:hypothetical protein